MGSFHQRKVKSRLPKDFDLEETEQVGVGPRELFGPGHRLCVLYWPMAPAAEQHNGFGMKFPVPTLRRHRLLATKNVLGYRDKDLERNWQDWAEGGEEYRRRQGLY